MEQNGRTRQKLTTVVAYVITLVWAASFIIDAVVKGYDPSPAVSTLMLIVAGYLFREGIIPRKRDNNGNSKKNTAAAD